MHYHYFCFCVLFCATPAAIITLFFIIFYAFFGCWAFLFVCFIFVYPFYSRSFFFVHSDMNQYGSLSLNVLELWENLCTKAQQRQSRQKVTSLISNFTPMIYEPHPYQTNVLNTIWQFEFAAVLVCVFTVQNHYRNIKMNDFATVIQIKIWKISYIQTKPFTCDFLGMMNLNSRIFVKQLHKMLQF